MTTIPGVGPQMQRASEGTDPRGWLVFHWLLDDLQAAEDSTAAADRDVMRPRGFERPATDAERILLLHLGFKLPAELKTVVHHRTRGVRHRSWPQLETQEVTTP
jgi:hypothetical protein